MNNLLQAAKQYKSAGLSITAVNNRKQSLHAWRKYQHTIMTEDELKNAFNNPAAFGIAIICGHISGNLEVIDIDCKNDLSGQLFHNYVCDIEGASAKLGKCLVMATTKNGGYHLFYRAKEIDRNLILAKRPCTDNEKAVKPQEKAKVLIETRGTGGYVIVHPTEGYYFFQHDFKNLPFIDPFERQMLLQIARSYNQSHEKIPLTHYSGKRLVNPNSPFDDFDSRGNIIGLLEKHGWKVIRTITDKTYFRRPGDTDHNTSGDFNHLLGLFGVFSSSTEFRPGKGYRPYAVYAILECDGDFRLAAKRLLDEGYGIPYLR